MYGRTVRQILTEAQLCRYSLGDFESRRTTVPSRNRRVITQAIEIAQEPLAHARKFRLVYLAECDNDALSRSPPPAARRRYQGSVDEIEEDLAIIGLVHRQPTPVVALA